MKAEIFNFNRWINETNSAKLRDKFDKILRKSGFTVLNLSEHHFQPYGYTALWLLGESHFAVHTFPEENKTYIELSSCNRKLYNKFLKLLQDGGTLFK
ncbi:S-adenosylmethionine decarboxylase [Candidatus Woesearchaeota archaeon]|nr:S-adenosylmethionine decarboxylase [Candidatus Woesearchaeota archaeon]